MGLQPMTIEEFIARHADEQFEWGKSDCLVFTNEAIKLLHGHGFCDDWLTDYDSPKTAIRRYSRGRKEEGKTCITEGLDSRLERVDTLHPRDGMVCARAALEPGPLGWSFGFVYGGLEWYRTTVGVVPLVPDGSAIYWRVT